jgi:hypothetical protein
MCESEQRMLAMCDTGDPCSRRRPGRKVEKTAVTHVKINFKNCLLLFIMYVIHYEYQSGMCVMLFRFKL